MNTSRSTCRAVLAPRALFLQVLTAALLSANSTQAATVGYTSSGGTAEPNVGYNLGIRFTPNQAFSIDSLGVYDNNGDGLSAPREVDLWRWSDEFLLASVTIGAGTVGTLDSGFRFAPITPVALTAGQLYIVSVVYSSSDGADDKVFNSTLTAWSGVTLSPGTYYSAGSTAVFPAGLDTQVRSTANFTATPEPGSVLLCGLGGVALLARRRRTR